MNYCRNCGAKLDFSENFCHNCGTKIHSQTSGGTNTVVNGQKSKFIAGILAILLGSLGIHNFYLGYTGKAVAQLLISVLTCGAGAAVTGIWGVIEGIMLLCGKIDKDGKGNPLKD